MYSDMQQRMASVVAATEGGVAPTLSAQPPLPPDNSGTNSTGAMDDEMVGLGFSNKDLEIYHQPAGLDTPIGANTRGHRLLLKLGWKLGQGLGKQNQGIKEVGHSPRSFNVCFCDRRVRQLHACEVIFWMRSCDAASARSCIARRTGA
jgi:G-patch domain